MAILLVDDEDNTREVLRGFLQHLGYKTILEARNGEEAFKICLKEKNQIRLIISDWEMPVVNGLELLKKIMAVPDLDLAPFLLITSDLPKLHSEEFTAIKARLDGYLQKPFQKKGLERAIQDAHTRRIQSRSVIICLSDRKYGNIENALVATGPSGRSHLRLMIYAGSSEEFKAATKTHASSLGAVFVDPETFRKCADDMLAPFKRTVLGIQTSCISLSREPGLASLLHAHCALFVDGNSTDAKWPELLETICNRLSHAKESETLMSEARAIFKEKDFKKAQSHVQRILDLDSTNAEAQNLMGDIHVHLGQTALAVEDFKGALAQNPCSPHGYIKLLELLPAESSKELAETAIRACEYCPHSPEVLLNAATVWLKMNNLKTARILVDKILQAHPKHQGALELRAQLQGPVQK